MTFDLVATSEYLLLPTSSNSAIGSRAKGLFRIAYFQSVVPYIDMEKV